MLSRVYRVSRVENSLLFGSMAHYSFNVVSTVYLKISKTRNHREHAWGTFLMGRNNFGQQFTLFCCILLFVAKHTPLNVHKI